MIGDLTEMSKMGYNTAFQRSYEAIRLGVYGICIRDGKILMIKTLCGDKYIYNFPGGGIEDNESLSDCLTRECKEELGCEITIENLLATSDKLYESTFFKTQKFNVYYNIDVLGTVNGDLEGATWFDLDKLPFDMMLENDKDLIAKINNK